MPRTGEESSYDDSSSIRSFSPSSKKRTHSTQNLRDSSSSATPLFSHRNTYLRTVTLPQMTQRATGAKRQKVQKLCSFGAPQTVAAVSATSVVLSWLSLAVCDRKFHSTQMTQNCSGVTLNCSALARRTLLLMFQLLVVLTWLS